ncbi:MAG: MFS transporter, partial [Myxococcota bacterium]
MLRSAVFWHVFALSGSNAAVGTVGLVQFLPALALTLVGGAVADAHDRLRIMRLAQLPYLASAALLFLATQSEAISVPLIYAAVFANAAAAAFDSPARQALLPSLVPIEAFPRAVTISSTAMALALASGPAVAGLLIWAFGVEAAYGAYGLLIAVNWIGLRFVRPLRALTERRAATWQAVREGLAFVRGSPVVLGCMALDMFAVVLGSAVALLPVYANDILGVGPRGYGLLASSLELGALAMAVVLVVRRPVERAGPALL